MNHVLNIDGNISEINVKRYIDRNIYVEHSTLLPSNIVALCNKLRLN